MHTIFFLPFKTFRSSVLAGWCRWSFSFKKEFIKKKEETTGQVKEATRWTLGLLRTRLFLVTMAIRERVCEHWEVHGVHGARDRLGKGPKKKTKKKPKKKINKSNSSQPAFQSTAAREKTDKTHENHENDNNNVDKKKEHTLIRKRRWSWITKSPVRNRQRTTTKNKQTRSNKRKRETNEEDDKTRNEIVSDAGEEKKWARPVLE